MNKRTDQRHNCEASYTCRCFNKDETFNGRMLNFSKSGMYFESGAFIKEGTTIYFNLINCSCIPSDPGHCEGLRSVSLAEVRWCQEMKNQDAPYFGIGVKYY
jgi:hypothetical protein